VLHGGDYLVQVAYVELSGFNLSSSMNVTAAGFAQLRFRGQANVSILMMQRQRLTLLLFATLVVLPCHAGRSGRGYQHRVFPLLCQLYGEASPGIPKEFGEVSNCMSDASFFVHFARLLMFAVHACLLVTIENTVDSVRA